MARITDPSGQDGYFVHEGEDVPYIMFTEPWVASNGKLLPGIEIFADVEVEISVCLEKIGGKGCQCNSIWSGDESVLWFDKIDFSIEHQILGDDLKKQFQELDINNEEICAIESVAGYEGDPTKLIKPITAPLRN